MDVSPEELDSILRDLSDHVEAMKLALTKYKGWAPEAATAEAEAWRRRVERLSPNVIACFLHDGPWYNAMHIHYSDDLRRHGERFRRDHIGAFDPPDDWHFG